ncbi:MAG: hypothetical protein IKG04_01440 [Exiguobacterium sp.]|nr:hypothetical protein [Exiguobacterium sp.]
MNLINLIDLCKVYDLPDPLSGIALPAPLDAEACRSAILIRCGMLEPVYYEPEVFTQIFASWFAMRDWNFKHLLAIIQAEYSPIENTDRYSEHKNTREGTDNTTHSGNDVTRDGGTTVTAASGTDTETRTPNLTEERTDLISAENASTYQADSKHTTTETGSEGVSTVHGKTDTTTHGKTETFEHGHVESNEYGGMETYTEHTHGNIGVTSNVTLINEELDLIRRFNVYEWIAERIEEDFFVQVY